MALLGSAALAMWWQLTPGMRDEFEHWHSHEHFPERLALPGFRRASRWTDAGGSDSIFVLYELANHEVLSAPPYLARLNAPSAWSTRMMPHHRDMVRSQCHVLASRGSGIARAAITLRLSPAPGREADLLQGLEALIEREFDQPGLAGMHLLQHQEPQIPRTTEQAIRGNDRVADLVLVACAYDATRLSALADTAFAPAHLDNLGAAPDRYIGRYALSHSATPADMASEARGPTQGPR